MKETEEERALRYIWREGDFTFGDDTQEKSQVGFIAPEPVKKGFLTLGRQQDVSETWKDTDGLRFKFIITSNGYRDRDGETITTKALEEYEARSWPAEDRCMPNNKHLFWHDEDLHIGDIVYCRMEGAFLWEVAKERAGSVQYKGETYPIASLWDYMEQHPEEQWGASHGFKYLRGDRDDGVYEWIDKFETSTLPLRHAANPYTFSGDIDMNQKDAFLDKMLGRDGVADKLRKAPLALQTALDEAGVKHKDFPPPQTTATDAAAAPAADAEPKPDPENTDPAVSMTAAVMQVINANNGTGTDVKEVEGQILAAIQAQLASAQPAAAAPPPPAPAAKALATDEIGRVDVLDAVKQLTAFNNQLVDQIAVLATDQGNIAKAIGALAPMLAANSGIPKALEGLTNRVESVEKQVTGRPRIASQDVATQIDVSELNPEIQKSLESYQTWMGVPVKNIPK